jgi:hypothetical protein
MAAPATNIKFDDGIRQVRSDSTRDDGGAYNRGGIGASTGVAGGVYNTRSLSRGPPERRRSFSRVSNERRHETIDNEEGDIWQRDDFRKKQIFRGKTVLWYVSLSMLNFATIC